jgi:hypothetical protein
MAEKLSEFKKEAGGLAESEYARLKQKSYF